MRVRLPAPSPRREDRLTPRLDLKNTSDDAIPNYLNSLKFKQNFSRVDTRLALGYSAFAIAAACFGWDYKFGFENTKYYTAAAVAVYAILNTVLTIWITFVEKGIVYEGIAPSGDKVRSESDPGDGEGQAGQHRPNKRRKLTGRGCFLDHHCHRHRQERACLPHYHNGAEPRRPSHQDRAQEILYRVVRRGRPLHCASVPDYARFLRAPYRHGRPEKGRCAGAGDVGLRCYEPRRAGRLDCGPGIGRGLGRGCRVEEDQAEEGLSLNCEASQIA